MDPARDDSARPTRRRPSETAELRLARAPIDAPIHLAIQVDVRDRLAAHGVRPDFERNPALAMECTVALVVVAHAVGSSTYTRWRDVIVAIEIDSVLAGWGLIPGATAVTDAITADDER